MSRNGSFVVPATIVMILVLCVTPAHAYTDPGTGALIWQMLLAASVGVMFYARRMVSWVRGLRARSGRGVPVSCPVLARTRDGERARVLPGPARGRSAPVLRQLFTLPPGRPGGPGHRG